MNVLLTLTSVPPMLLVPILREGTTAHVTLDTMEMDSPAAVLILSNYFFSLTESCFYNSVADTDECSDALNQCHDNSTCHDIDGSYECSCDHGFTGNGFYCSGIYGYFYFVQQELDEYRACIDIDECSAGTDMCASNATCTNTEGGYNCSCDTGYYGDGFTCNGKYVTYTLQLEL